MNLDELPPGTQIIRKADGWRITIRNNHSSYLLVRVEAESLEMAVAKFWIEMDEV